MVKRFRLALARLIGFEAGNWFAENGLIEEALHHALEADDTEAAVQPVLLSHP